jgi:hypothetical protein
LIFNSLRGFLLLRIFYFSKKIMMSQVCVRRCARPVVGVFLVTWLACTGTPTADQRFERLGQAYCSCTARLAELDGQMAAIAQDSTRTEEFLRGLETMQKEYDAVKVCLTPALNDFGRLSADDLRRLEADFGKFCPDRVPVRDQLQEFLGQ